MHLCYLVILLKVIGLAASFKLVAADISLWIAEGFFHCSVRGCVEQLMEIMKHHAVMVPLNSSLSYYGHSGRI